MEIKYQNLRVLGPAILKVKMIFTEKEKKFDPEKVYKDQPNPTKI